MPDRLPPLTALRAFDAAARHMSFAKAAEELNVTPAALSFQIKSLEDHFGAPLFRRLNRAVELTEAGRALAPGTAEAFRSLTAAWRAAHRTQEGDTLIVTAGPAFTAKWLAPRLYQFASAHPEIDLRFSASLKFASFDHDDVDVAIRFGTRDYPKLYSVSLAQEWVTPVMTPKLAKKYPKAKDLINAPLIFDDSLDFLDTAYDWPQWFKEAGIDYVPEHGTHFSQADHAVDAAISGVGVALARRGFVIKDLAEGTLVAPYGIALAMDAQYRFLCRKGDEDRAPVAAFRDWIFSEIEKTAFVSDTLSIRPVSS